MSFGAVLQRIRREKGKTQREVAAAIGMDYTYFSRLENDRFDSKPTRETVMKIADALGCTPAERSELLAAAGRIDEDMERAARTTLKRPDLKPLFRRVAKLTPDEAKELEEILKTRFGRKGEKS